MSSVEATHQAFLEEHPEWRDQTMRGPEGNLSSSSSAAIAYINWLVEKGFASSPQEAANLRQKIMVAEDSAEELLFGPAALDRMMEFLNDQPEWQQLIETEEDGRNVMRMPPEGLEAYLGWLVAKQHLKPSEVYQILKSIEAVTKCL